MRDAGAHQAASLQRLGLDRIALGLVAIGLTLLHLAPITAPGVRAGGPAVETSLPLLILPNRGQVVSDAHYYATGPGYSFQFFSDHVLLGLHESASGQAVALRPQGGRSVQPTAARPQGTAVNYILSREAAESVSAYGEVRYPQVWPGIDLSFRGADGALKYELRLNSAASLGSVRLSYDGAEHLAIDRMGRLRITTEGATLTDAAPVAWQWVDGRKLMLPTRYVLLGGTSYGFAVDGADPVLPLLVDPGIGYSTYLGGPSSDFGLAVAVDSDGNTWLSGSTLSTSFPTTPGAYDPTAGGSFDAFVAKLDPTGSSLLSATYLGGSSSDSATAIAVDAAGDVYVAGTTFSADFPVTDASGPAGGSDIFLARLDPSAGSLLYGTVIGGSLSDSGTGIAVAGDGLVAVSGFSSSQDFPAGPGSTHSGSNDAVLLLVDTTGFTPTSALLLGGSGSDQAHAVAVQGSSVWLAGQTASGDLPVTDGSTYSGNTDAFVARYEAGALASASYLGGSAGDIARAIEAGAGGTYVVGETRSADFPGGAPAGGADAFVVGIGPSGPGGALLIGGTGDDRALGVARGPDGLLHLAGETTSPDLPTSVDAPQGAASGAGDAFIASIDPAGWSVVFTSYLGGSGFDMAASVAATRSGGILVHGRTGSPDFPTTPGAYDVTHNGGLDAFLVLLGPAVPPAPASIALAPEAAVGEVGAPHTVTAYVEDDAGRPLVGVEVRFSVAGTVSAGGTCQTGAEGLCSFSYPGPELPGDDVVTAFADADRDGVRDPDEPMDSASASWVVPAGTAGRANGAGTVRSGEHTRTTLLSVAVRSDGTDTKGNCIIHDKSPERKIKCGEISALVLDGDRVRIYGTASDSGYDTPFLIEIVDGGNPGKGRDSFRVLTGTGYEAVGTLESGNLTLSG